MRIFGDFGGEKLEVYAVRGGVGKANAAAVCALLCQECDIIINFGLCGGLSVLHRGDVVICKDYVEHDMDFSALGRMPTERCEGEYYITPDRYVNALKRACPEGIVGKAATGDSFVGDNETVDFLTKIGAVCCDMESAAAAQACQICGVPFASFKLVSDNADDDAKQSYREMYAMAPDRPAKIFRALLSELNK
ncbi:MAG: 5'-methylthioadenosine/S-adenosylhomocysteine nucleosidase [Oscillospiraceae bacterium]|nr:5'-methylthioadenosine/S-adenosylhomocysteine nucleosidase [Candidatus Equicaccousia limihippi]